MAFIRVWQAGVYWLQCHMAQRCSATAWPWQAVSLHSLPQPLGCSLTRLLPGEFSGKSTQIPSCGSLFFLCCHPNAPVHKWCRLLLLRKWNRNTWVSGKHLGLMINLKNAILPWCNQEVLVRSGISWHAWLVRYAKPKGYTGCITAGCVNLPKAFSGDWSKIVANYAEV